MGLKAAIASPNAAAGPGVGRYVARVLAAAEHDPDVASRLAGESREPVRASGSPASTTRSCGYLPGGRYIVWLAYPMWTMTRSTPGRLYRAARASEASGCPARSRRRRGP